MADAIAEMKKKFKLSLGQWVLYEVVYSDVLGKLFIHYHWMSIYFVLGLETRRHAFSSIFYEFYVELNGDDFTKERPNEV